MDKCKECGYPRVYAKGLCRNCYSRITRSGKVKRERKTEPSEKQKKILEMYNETGDALKTANEFGCSRQYVYAVIREYKKRTNADRIRAMTDEELAARFADTGDCPNNDLTCDCECVKCWEKWLKEATK